MLQDNGPHHPDRVSVEGHTMSLLVSVYYFCGDQYSDKETEFQPLGQLVLAL